MAIATFAAFALTAAPAGATSVQTQAGTPYTGTLNGAMTGGATFITPIGVISCNTSTFTGSVIGSGAGSDPASAAISTIDWLQGVSNSCPMSSNPVITHTDTAPITLPWGVAIAWASDNTTGTANGTFGMHLDQTTTFNVAANCHYTGSALSFGQVVGDFFNPNNTASGNTEVRFSNELLTLAPAPFPAPPTACPAFMLFSATYVLTGQAGVKLQIRQSVPVPGPTNTSPAGTLPSNPTTSSNQTKKSSKCKSKKKKKGKKAAAAKKCKKKKKKK